MKGNARKKRMIGASEAAPSYGSASSAPAAAPTDTAVVVGGRCSRITPRTKGYVLVVGGVLLITPDTLLIRGLNHAHGAPPPALPPDSPPGALRTPAALATLIAALWRMRCVLPPANAVRHS